MGVSNGIDPSGQVELGRQSVVAAGASEGGFYACVDN